MFKVVGRRMRGEFDAVFVGGGLSTALSVLSLRERMPSFRLAIVERGATLGGNHTWCFHARDVPARAASMVKRLEIVRWPGYEVRFPRRTRALSSTYACITSERLHDVLSDAVSQAGGSALFLDTQAAAIERDQVRLEDGRVLRAPLVIDATGPREDRLAGRGYQKFFGLELAVEGAAPRVPTVFDARIAQRDGFRFMYVLPFTPTRLLVEETFFSERPELDEARSEAAILAYVERELGLRVREIVRRERGILPMPWREPELDIAARPLPIGYRGGLFHPVTGYSFPIALRFALALTDQLGGDAQALDRFAAGHRAQRPFLRLLTQLLFRCFAPDERYGVLEHFYRLPEPVIERFYAADLTPLDRARIFWGAPPRGFSVARALRQPSSVGAAP
jgi:lycopene beta-cyclase